VKFLKKTSQKNDARNHESGLIWKLNSGHLCYHMHRKRVLKTYFSN